MSALIKSLETHIALKPPVLIMDAADVSIQFALVFIRCTALTTFEEPLCNVRPLMPLPLLFVKKGSITNCALDPSRLMFAVEMGFEIASSGIFPIA